MQDVEGGRGSADGAARPRARGRRPNHVEARTAARSRRNRGAGLHVLCRGRSLWLCSAPLSPLRPLCGPSVCILISLIVAAYHTQHILHCERSSHSKFLEIIRIISNLLVMESFSSIDPLSFRSTGEEERVHQCGECGLTLSTRSALTAHARSHRAAADAHRCDFCNKTFAVPARLVRHYRTHTGERPFECEYCHKMFSVKENLQVHRRIHTKERPYRCTVCSAAFEHSGKLHRHARIHTGERPHACPHCQKTFIQSGQLVIHLRTHTGEKPYRCPAPGCGKGFTCSKQLKVHSRTHTGERPYTCDICLRDFGYNHVLKLHRFQHYGERCYRCTVCDGTFNTKKQMEAHIHKEHGAESSRAPALQPTVPLVVNGTAMCDIVEAALQQLPPTPPSSPPSPQSAATLPAVSVQLVPPPVAPLVIPPSPTKSIKCTLEPSTLPLRKRKLIHLPDTMDVNVMDVQIVRHTSVIQFAPAANDSQSQFLLQCINCFFYHNAKMQRLVLSLQRYSDLSQCKSEFDSNNC